MSLYLLPAAAAARRDVDRQVQLSCGEHTDYGLLTLVNQDCGVTALQVSRAVAMTCLAAPCFT
jgi:isopenicillin N synthase-like dioxygenase